MHLTIKRPQVIHRLLLSIHYMCGIRQDTDKQMDKQAENLIAVLSFSIIKSVYCIWNLESAILEMKGSMFEFLSEIALPSFRSCDCEN